MSEGSAIGNPVDAWKNRLQRTEKRQVRATLANAMIIVAEHEQLAGRLGFDERSQTPRWIKAPPWDRIGEPRDLVEADGAEFCEWIIGEDDGLSFASKLPLEAIVTVAHRSPFDLVLNYLASLVWDGSERVDSWLTTYLGASDDPFTAAVGAAWMISAVARARRPGCKADHMIVLNGLQGSLKSTAIEVLAGEENYAEIAIDVSSKDSALALHGPWLIEWSELAGLGRRETEQVKSFLSRASDRLRPPYGRFVVNLQRRCVVAGTTNDQSYLSDLTGNRRYWPITVGAIDLESLARDRDQLWAEAVQRYEAKCPWWLDAESEQLAIEAQEEHLLADSWEEAIISTLASGSLALKDWVSSGDLLLTVGIELGHHNSGHARRVARIMKRLGWKGGRKQPEGSQKKVSGYERPLRRTG